MAMGARFEDAQGRPIPLGNVGLTAIAHVDLSTIDVLPPEGIIALTDVTNPLLGPNGAAAVFGPQKGASATDVREFDAALAHLAEVVGRSTAEAPGAGAAGGTGYGLLAIGARVQSGALAIAEAIDLPSRIATADLVITGEGSFDDQSLAGKVPSAVLNIAAEHGVPVAVVAGRVAEGLVGTDFGPTQARSLTDLAGSAAAAMADTEHWLEVAGAELARSQS